MFQMWSNLLFNIIKYNLIEKCVKLTKIFSLQGEDKIHVQRYHEIGRAVATIMSDEIFHDVAYKVSISLTFYERLFVQNWFVKLFSNYSLAL